MYWNPFDNYGPVTSNQTEMTSVGLVFLAKGGFLTGQLHTIQTIFACEGLASGFVTDEGVNVGWKVERIYIDWLAS